MSTPRRLPSDIIEAHILGNENNCAALRTSAEALRTQCSWPGSQHPGTRSLLFSASTSRTDCHRHGSLQQVTALSSCCSTQPVCLRSRPHSQLLISLPASCRLEPRAMGRTGPPRNHYHKHAKHRRTKGELEKRRAKREAKSDAAGVPPAASASRLRSDPEAEADDTVEVEVEVAGDGEVGRTASTALAKKPQPKLRPTPKKRPRVWKLGGHQLLRPPAQLDRRHSRRPLQGSRHELR